jgi:phosphonate transport system permease protein
VNEFVFALMFVTAVGLGPFAGMLALGIHTGGVLGKLLSETIEAIDPGQVEGVTAVGAPRLHIIGFGVVPQILPNFLSYILLRFESDIRSASVIGMVGGGRHRFLSVGHDPRLQRPRGGHGHSAHRRNGHLY